MKISCFGEVLWDVFPKGKKIGGAPLNVALRLQSMGVEVAMITRVGDDPLGKELINYLVTQGVSTEMIQLDHQYETGQVFVSLDASGSAFYEICNPVAWDYINIEQVAIQTVKDTDAIIFGTLSCRNPISKKTLFSLLDYANFKVLDLNLRPPYYNNELVFDLIKQADFLKLNEVELEEVCTALCITSTTTEERIRDISLHFKIDQICVTLGAEGAILLYQNEIYQNLGYQVKVVDTVGAGDSFLATLICRLLQNETPDVALDDACVMGAMVAGQEGANPNFEKGEIKRFKMSKG